MKFKAKDGRVYNDRIAMTLANVRHQFAKKKEDELMDFEEFDDDDFNYASDDEDEDESSPIIDTLVVHRTGDNQVMLVNESHDQSPTPVASYTISLDDAGNETLPKGDYSVPFTPGTSKDAPKERIDGAWGFIPDNRSDGVIEDEMHLIRGYLNEDIPEYVDKLNRVAPRPDSMEVVDETHEDGVKEEGIPYRVLTEADMKNAINSANILDEEKKPTRYPYELTEEEKKAWVPTNSLLPPRAYFDTVIRRECDKMNVNTPSSRSVLYDLNIIVEINGVKMNAAKAMEYAELNDRLINDILDEETDEEEPEQL